MASRKPRILLAAPTYHGKSYCLESWVRNVRAIQKHTPCDVLLVDNSDGDAYARLIRKQGVRVLRSPAYPEPLKSLGEARRVLNEHVIRNGYDYLFSLEQDLFPPVDIIERLLRLRKSIKARRAIVGAPYVMKYITREKPPFSSIDRLTSVSSGLVFSRRAKRKIQLLMTQRQLMTAANPLRVFAAGLGCTLVETPILREHVIQYDQPTFKPDDAFFYLECEAKGIPVYIDPTLLQSVIHIPGDLYTIDSWWAPKRAKPKN